MTNIFEDLDFLPDAKSTGAAARGVDLDRVLVANGGNAHKALVECPKCAGQGTITIGYTNLRRVRCFRCDGKGQISIRSMAAIKARATTERNRAEVLADWRKANADVVTFLNANADWSDFYRSLREQATERPLTDKQVASVRSGMAKQAERAQARVASAPRVDVSAIERLFATARASGLKRPVFRAAGIEISQAPATGINAGALYVKAGGTYQGKVANGAFLQVRAALASTSAAVLAIAADPLGQATMHGKLTGSCSCCGRELTDPVSVANGIGPICARKWGI
jgi:hypothetical protein